MKNQTLFESARLSLDQSIELTRQSITAYGVDFEHWAIAYSGGKDSSAVLSLVLYFLKTGQIKPPKSLTVLYADTRQELPPLHMAAMSMLDHVRELGFEAQRVLPPIEKRFWPYILGRGVPSPNNGTLRWCTRQIKGEPMQKAIDNLPGDKVLMMTGVRLGESAVRDQRIAISCSKDGGECGQGYFQAMSGSRFATLAPIVHFRVCHVWDWLVMADIEHGYPLYQVAEAYGMTESIEAGEEPINARTGCIGCPLVSTQDTALERLLKNPKWSYLAPLRGIAEIHAMARDRRNRLRKIGGETRKDGSLVKNQGRFGPIVVDVRAEMLERLLAIQAEINATPNKPDIDLINADEEAFIRQCLADKVYPDKWDGTEPIGTTWIDEPIGDSGMIQPLLFQQWS
jgi:DNA sulfur modification protein DndC